MAARRAALWVLQAVLRRKESLDDAIANAFAGTGPHSALSSRDRAFARLIAATCLRRLGQIDAVIDGFQKRRLPRRSGPAQDILRLGTAQILFLGTAPHAAVTSAVDLANADRNARHFKNLINAVLRRVAREGAAIVAGQDAAQLNTPEWLFDAWVTAYGTETARAIATAHLAEPPLDIMTREDAAVWQAPLEAELLLTGTLRRTAGGRVEDLPGFADGAWWVQDVAAALPVRLLGDVSRQEVLDLCAAPGGKTAQLAAAGAHVTALDRSAARLARLQENLARLGLNAICVTADASEWRPSAPFSHILLDAPCSATGTIRRHPDIPYRKTREQIAQLTAIQDTLLQAAAAMLAPAGTLVYCTCSLEPEEGPERIAKLLDSDRALQRAPILPEELGGLPELITAVGDLRTLPCHLPEAGGMDGFYAARLRHLGN